MVSDHDFFYVHDRQRRAPPNGCIDVASAFPAAQNDVHHGMMACYAPCDHREQFPVGESHNVVN